VESGLQLGRTDSTCLWGIALFVTGHNVRRLLDCGTIYVDGTFRTAPHPYVQMITIHGLYRGVVIPLCFSLVSGKTVGQYRQILQHIAGRIRTVCHRRWRPVTVVCDFEIALITALQTELPRTRIRGCYFHYTQSLWRKVAALGLASRYRSNSSRGRRMRKVIQKVMALGFLPSLLVARAFQVVYHGYDGYFIGGRKLLCFRWAVSQFVSFFLSVIAAFNQLCIRQ